MLSEEGAKIVSSRCYITEEIPIFCFIFHTGSGIQNVYNMISIRENVQGYVSNPF
jgi:hypothetical protein